MPTTKTKPEQDRDLDKSLEQSFPASDPASTNESGGKPERPPGRQTPIIDKHQVDGLAKQAERKSRNH